MANITEPTSPRVFKTAWFSKNAKKVGITDDELCEAVRELTQGLWDADLGGNVFKKRLNENRHRSIVITKTDAYWFFTFLFSKAERDNITDRELAAFKKLSKDYAKLDDKTVAVQVTNKDLLEICNDCPKKI
jgi:hypothetical protein